MHERGSGLGDVGEDCTEARRGRPVTMFGSWDGEDRYDVVTFDRGKQAFGTERPEQLWEVAVEERESVVDNSGRVVVRWVAHGKVTLDSEELTVR